jgi:hypothetical protein
VVGAVSFLRGSLPANVLSPLEEFVARPLNPSREKKEGEESESEEEEGYKDDEDEEDLDDYEEKKSD